MRHSKKHKLSITEKKIMNFFWTAKNKDVTVRDVMENLKNAGYALDYQNTEAHLQNLEKTGMLRTEVRNGMCYYSPAMAKAEYTLPLLNRVFKKPYFDSIERIISINHIVYTITDEEADELLQLIQTLSAESQEENQ